MSTKIPENIFVVGSEVFHNPIGWKACGEEMTLEQAKALLKKHDIVVSAEWPTQVGYVIDAAVNSDGKGKRFSCAVFHTHEFGVFRVMKYRDIIAIAA